MSRPKRRELNWCVRPAGWDHGLILYILIAMREDTRDESRSNVLHGKEEYFILVIQYSFRSVLTTSCIVQ